MRNPQDNTDDHWEAIMTHMRIRAGLTGQQSRDILAYLQSSNYIAGAVPSTGIAAGSGSPGLSGEQVYSGTCIACHGADGNGAIPGVPVLFERLVKTDETLFKHIKEGFQSPGSTLAMPALGGNPDLADKDIENVLGYLRQKFGK
jgi:mono/diheme cytochrome c family protein